MMRAVSISVREREAWEEYDRRNGTNRLQEILYPCECEEPTTEAPEEPTTAYDDVCWGLDK